MNKVEMHINRLFRNIPESRRKIEIIQEITQDLNDKVADLIEQGYSEDEAVQKAIDEFGDISEIQYELMDGHKVIRNRDVGLALAFSVWGSLLITALMIFINIYYSPRTIWFVYPVFAVIWWPLTLFFVWYKQKKGIKMGFPFSVASAALFLALMIFINAYYTPDVIWCIYPIFGVIWWPVAMLFVWYKHKRGIRIGFPFSVAGAVLIAALMIFINAYYTPKTIWCVYPIFGVIWWPVAMLFNWLRSRSRKEDY